LSSSTRTFQPSSTNSACPEFQGTSRSGITRTLFLQP
jgi:hypothetical protein